MDRKISLLHLVDHIKNVGNGITNVVVDLSIEMSSMGIKVGVFSSGGDFLNLLHSNNIETIACNNKNILSTARDLAKHLNGASYGIVHIHTPRMAAVYLIAKILTTRKIISLTTIHNSFQKSSWLLSIFKNVVCLSQADINKFSKINRLTHFYKIINGTFGSKRSGGGHSRKIDRSGYSVIFTTVANMCYRKGIDILLTAYSEIAKEYPTSLLNLVGDGIDIDAFKALSKSLGIEKNVRYWGRVDNPKDIILSSDVFVLASRRDPCPLVIFEAMECGVAIIGSNVDGIPEQLGYGKYGSIFTTIDELKTEMLQAILDQKRLSRLKRDSIKGLKIYNLKNTTRQYTTIYRKLLNDN